MIGSCPICYFVYVTGFEKILQIETHDSESRGQEEAAIIRETKIMRPLKENH